MDWSLRSWTLVCCSFTSELVRFACVCVPVCWECMRFSEKEWECVWGCILVNAFVCICVWLMYVCVILLVFGVRMYLCDSEASLYCMSVSQFCVKVWSQCIAYSLAQAIWSTTMNFRFWHSAGRLSQLLDSYSQSCGTWWTKQTVDTQTYHLEAGKMCVILLYVRLCVSFVCMRLGVCVLCVRVCLFVRPSMCVVFVNVCIVCVFLWVCIPAFGGICV